MTAYFTQLRKAGLSKADATRMTQLVTKTERTAEEQLFVAEVLIQLAK